MKKLLFIILFIILVVFNGCIDDEYILLTKKNTPIDTIINIDTIIIEQEHLVAYYPFNGNANDESGNNNDGVVNGAKLTNDRFGKSNSAYEFNGKNNTIDIPNSNKLDFSDDKLTLSFWMKSTDQSYGEYINKYSGLGKTVSGFMIAFGSNSIYYMYADAKTTGGWGGTESTLSSNIWIHIVVTTDNGYDKLYINGKISNTSKQKHNYHIGSNNQKLRFGAGPIQNVGKYYNGSFDDIRIYNIAITDSEVLSLYMEKK